MTRRGVDVKLYESAFTIEEILQEHGVSPHGKILCPAHDDSRPSMQTTGGFCYCHGCEQAYNTLGLIGLLAFGYTDLKGKRFLDVLEWIRKKKGWAHTDLSKEAKEMYARHLRIANTLEEVWKHSTAGTYRLQADAYLRKRGLPISEIEYGFLPNGYRPLDLDSANEAGLLSDTGHFLLGGRVIFPIRNPQGEIVELYGRSLTPGAKLPHMFTKKSADKKPGLWGIEHVKQHETVYVCEGIIDALTLIRHGLRAVATAPISSFKGLRLDLLVTKQPKHVVMCYDADPNGTGQKRARIAAAELMEKGIRTSFINLPLGEDCNSYLKSRSSEEFLSLDRVPWHRQIGQWIAGLKDQSDQDAALREALETIARLDSLEQKRALDCLQAPTGHSLPFLKKLLKQQEEANAPDWTTLAKRAVDTHTIIYCEETFYRYDRGRYVEIQIPELEELIKQTLPEKMQNTRTYTEIANHIKHPGIGWIPPTSLNHRRDLFNLRNAMLEIDTGKVIPHSPEFFSTIQADFEYHPRAKHNAVAFRAFLDRVLPDIDLQVLLQQFAGSCLDARLSHGKAFVLYGQGANGKSVFLHALSAALGQDNVSNIPLAQLGKDDFVTIALHNKLLNISADWQAGDRVDHWIVKSVITGDRIQANRKYKQPIEFTPFAKNIIACNERPRTMDRTHGFMRRFTFIPFDHTIPEDEQNPNLANELIAEELDGIFHWMLQGLKQLRAQNQKFERSERSEEEKQTYMIENEPALEFLEVEEYVCSPGGRTDRADLFARYREWAEENGYKPVSQRSFATSVKKKFPDVETRTVQGKRKWSLYRVSEEQQLEVV